MLATPKQKLATLVLLTSATLASHADDTVWTKELIGDDIEGIYTHDNALYIHSYSTNETRCEGQTNCDYIAKYSLNGTLLWSKSYNGIIPTNLVFTETGLFFHEWGGNQGQGALQSLTYDGEQGISLNNYVEELVDYLTPGTDLNWEEVYPVNRFSYDESGFYFGVSLGLLYDPVNDTLLDDGDTFALVHIDHQGDLQWAQETKDRWGYAVNVDNSYVYFENVLEDDTTTTLVYSTDGEFQTEITTDVGKTPYGEEARYGDAKYAYTQRQSTYGTAGYGYITQYNLANEIVWHAPFLPRQDGYYSNGRILGVVADDSSVIAVGIATLDGSSEESYVLARYSFDGELLSTKALDLPVDIAALSIYTPVALELANNRLFMTLPTSSTSSSPRTSTLVEVNLASETTPTNQAPVLLNLGDINGDDQPEYASVKQEEDSLVANVYSTAATTQLTSVVLTGISSYQDIKVVSDLNGNGAGEIAVLAADNSVVIHDSLTGELINHVAFASNITPISMQFAPDLNNNGAAEIAVLGAITNGNGNVVITKDTSTGEQISSTYFNPNYTPKDFTFVSDVDGDASPEIAVLSTDARGISKFAVRSLEGQMLKNIWLGKAYGSHQLVSLPSTTDNSPVLATAFAALQTKVDGDGVAVRVMDVTSGEEIQAVGYNWNFAPVVARAIADSNGNDTPEIAILGIKTDANGDTSTKIEVKDSHSANLVKNLWHTKTISAIDFTVIADINGNGSEETITLVDKNGTYQAIIHDSLTGAKLQTVTLSEQ